MPFTAKAARTEKGRRKPRLAHSPRRPTIGHVHGRDSPYSCHASLCIRYGQNVAKARRRTGRHNGKSPCEVRVVTGLTVFHIQHLHAHQGHGAKLLRDAGIPASVSNTAGTFVCNHVFYALMHRLARRAGPGVRGGFIHIPALPQQAAQHPGMASMALETQVQGIRRAIHTAMTVQEDLQENAGQLH